MRWIINQLGEIRVAQLDQCIIEYIKNFPQSIHPMINLVDKLKNVQLLTGVDSDAITAITAFCTERQLHPGEIITSEDTDDYNLYIVTNGSVEVTIKSRMENQKPLLSKVFMTGYGQHELIGEVNWLRRQRRTATVKCIDTVDLIQIDGTALWTLLLARPEIGVRVVHNVALTLADRLNDADLTLKQFALAKPIS